MNNELNREINLKSILAFTLPSIFMMVVMSLYTIVDGIFVSRLINTNAFSAVNIIYPLMSIVIGLGTMFGTGTTAIVSRKLGEGRQKEAKPDRYIHYSVYDWSGHSIFRRLLPVSW